MERPKNIPRLEYIAQCRSMNFSQTINEKLHREQPDVFSETVKLRKEHKTLLTE